MPPETEATVESLLAARYSRFVEKVGGRPLTYSQALSMFKKVQEVVGTALGDEALAAAPYGLLGARC